ncbi:MAG: hypothetical protein JW966_12085 [Anaerolineae bacterium]|nr:hypothetical protein [Anaerolineae bacterium]
MTKAKSEPASRKQAKADQSPLRAFVDHQVNALEETGRAIESLLPKEFRTHVGNAVKEGAAGFTALFDGVIDTVQDGLDHLRHSPKETDEKVKVEVD